MCLQNKKAAITLLTNRDRDAHQVAQKKWQLQNHFCFSNNFTHQMWGMCQFLSACFLTVKKQTNGASTLNKKNPIWPRAASPCLNRLSTKGLVHSHQSCNTMNHAHCLRKAMSSMLSISSKQVTQRRKRRQWW